MTRHPLTWLTALSLAALTTTTAVRAETLDLAFLPPQVIPQNLCLPGNDPNENPLDDLRIDEGDDGLTDELRLQYIRRDIRNLQAEDARRWFAFIMSLIEWQAEIDPEFAGEGETIAKIELYVDAGRLDELSELGFIDELRQSSRTLTNPERMGLARYYLNGIGVQQDIPFAQSLMRDAAYGGNPDALLSIARMALQGEPVQGWDAPLDMTVTLAFGGMLGEMNAEVCRHAERIGQQYLSGDVVTRNPEIALAWFRFAADLGGANAAWRIVEFHLEADADRKDHDELVKYLRLAVERGITVDSEQADRIMSRTDADDAEIREILGFNFSADTGRTRPSVSSYFQLRVNIDAEEADVDSTFLEYLREVILLETAPGFVFTTLAKEVLIREGRWDGETEAIDLLEEATRRQDPEGTHLLGRMLVHFRDDPAQFNRSVNLLTEAVERHGRMAAMDDLDGLYRCQSNQAPHLSEAEYWAANFRATQSESVDVSATDLIVLDPFKAPETLAQIQTQALLNDTQSMARYLELVQIDPLATEDAKRLWASRIDNSDRALEAFAELEFTLASNPAERDLAVELFRRIYLNNGVTTALDLSIALVEDNGRDTVLAAEIEDLLVKAGNRGEGAAIRLLARLTTEPQGEISVYQQFADIIEERGDFLALMFAIPYVSLERADHYIDRAVSLMTCGTKDVAELADAMTILQQLELAFHWQRIGIVIQGGNVLAKLAITDRQMAAFDTGAAPTQREVFERALADGDLTANRSLYFLTADPDLPSYDPEAAAEHLLALMGTADEEAFVLGSYRIADPEIRAALSRRVDMENLFLRAAQRGDIVAKRDYAILVRDTAASLVDLQTSARWLQEAADGGDIVAMAELGRALAYGIGIPEDKAAALVLLEQAERAGNVEAMALARLVRLEVVP